jgi:hypothetical protein
LEDDKPIKSETVRCGKRTYFFDVKVTQKGDKYLKITETRLMAEGEPRKRSMIMVFPEDIKSFTSVFTKLSVLLTHP